jgi:hypothetical protein
MRRLLFSNCTVIGRAEELHDLSMSACDLLPEHAHVSARRNAFRNRQARDDHPVELVQDQRMRHSLPDCHVTEPHPDHKAGQRSLPVRPAWHLKHAFRHDDAARPAKALPQRPR